MHLNEPIDSSQTKGFVSQYEEFRVNVQCLLELLRIN